MTLTPAQQTILKNHILATPVLDAFPNNEDGAGEIAKLLNLEADPTFTVWKDMVTLEEIGNNFDGSELANLSGLENDRLMTIAAYSPSGINPSLTDRRAFFDDVFSGAQGADTRALLLILWKRLTNEIEKLYATGTGSDAVPGILVFIGTITGFDVNEARNS